MSNKDEYVAKMEAELKRWSAKIGEMKTRALKAAAENRAGLEKRVEAAEAHHQKLNRRLHELRTAGEDGFAALKAGFESAWKEFTSLVDKK